MPAMHFGSENRFDIEGINVMALVKVYTTRDEIEASVIQGVLRVYGVEIVIKDKSLKSAGYPGVAGTKGNAGVET